MTADQPKTFRPAHSSYYDAEVEKVAAVRPENAVTTNQAYYTYTIVVRAEAVVDEDGNGIAGDSPALINEDGQIVIPADETVFITYTSGVSRLAVALGADPALWDDAPMDDVDAAVVREV